MWHFSANMAETVEFAVMSISVFVVGELFPSSGQP